MDRHFSSSIGLPVTTHDSDITTLLDPPTTCSQQDATLSLQVRLSQLISTILTSKFGLDLLKWKFSNRIFSMKLYTKPKERS